MIFGLVAMGIGVLFGVFAALVKGKYNAIERGETYKGLVTTVLKMKRNKQKITVPIVQIKVDGEVYAHQASNVFGTRTYHENEKVSVKWNKKHHDKIYIEGDNTMRNNSVTLFVIAAILFAVGVVLVLKDVLA